MNARVVTSQLQPGKKDEWIAIIADSIVPALRDQNSFCAPPADENRFNQHCSKVAYSGLDCQDNDGIQRLRRQK
jgi:hypothetical protein